MAANTLVKIFLFLAYFSIAGHAFIPHHHHALMPSEEILDDHQMIPCTSSHSEDHSDTHPAGEFINCMLNQAFFQPSNQYRHILQQSWLTDFHIQIKLLPVELRLDEVKLSVTDYPFLYTDQTAAYTGYIQRSKGLRAPPEA